MAARIPFSEPASCVLSLALVALAAGCSTGSPGGAVRPDSPTARDVVDGTTGDCREVPSHGTPLVVDWKPMQRIDLESTLSHGIAVVSYDCGGLKLLPDCQLPGSYGYVGVSRNVEVIQLQNRDEVRANLPALGVELMGEVESESAFDLAMVLVGKKRTVIASARADELQGTGCQGATHFVRGAYLGAFALETGTAGKIAAAAEILGRGSAGKSQASRRMLRSAGEPDACKGASLSAETPPDECGSVLRVELRALGKTRTAAADVDIGDCPEGFVADGGKCVRAGGRAPDCSLEKPAGCAALCDQGNMTSCSILGYAHHYALSGTGRDLHRAAALYARACEAGIHNACSGLGVFLETGKGGLVKDLPRAIALHERACAAGDSRGCLNLGFLIMKGRGRPRDLRRSVELFERACAAGNAVGCGNLAVRLLEGEGTDRDERRARSLLEETCPANPFSCMWLGHIYRDGLGVAANATEAATHYRRGCDAPETSAARGEDCALLGLAHFRGEGVPRNAARALELLQKGCALESPWACKEYSAAYRNGEYVAVDHARANAIASRACEANVAGSCGELGYSAETGRAMPVDIALAIRRYGQACDLYEGWACENLGNLYYFGTKIAKDAGKGVALYKRACDLGDDSACRRLGWIYKKGEVVPRDALAALRYYEQGCGTKGDPEACYQAANMLRQGEGVKDHPRALQIYERLCRDGDGEACLRASELHVSGEGVPPNADRVLELIKRGCGVGIPDACGILSEVYRQGKGVPANQAQADSYRKMACSAPSRFRCREHWSESLCEQEKKRWQGQAAGWCSF